LSTALQSLSKLNSNELEDFAAGARKIVEDAWEAVERHTSEHGC